MAVTEVGDSIPRLREALAKAGVHLDASRLYAEMETAIDGIKEMDPRAVFDQPWAAAFAEDAASWSIPPEAIVAGVQGGGSHSTSWIPPSCSS